MSRIAIASEIGRLRTVIVHEAGPEIETVTPARATEALYDDVLFPDTAAHEHRQLTAVLGRVARVHRLDALLADVLAEDDAREALLAAICRWHGCPDLAPALADRPAAALAAALIQGVRHPESALAGAIDPAAWAITPSPNAFFTRDPAFCIGARVVVGAMARRVRGTEALIMRALFASHPALAGDGALVDGVAAQADSPRVMFEGGDIHVLREDLLVIGCSERTSAPGIQRLLDAVAATGQPFDVVVVLLPRSRATIHLDMIFTVVDRDLCVVFEPLVSGAERCRVVGARVQDGRVARFAPEDALLPALARRGMPLEPVPCGGADPTRQVREQWASGANLFAFGPGKVIGYGRNRGTFEALAAHGFRIVQADDVAAGTVDPLAPGRCAVMMSGAESSRGGGGCRCMTLPVSREPVDTAV